MKINQKELMIIKDALEGKIFYLDQEIRIHEDLTNSDEYTEEEIADYTDGWNCIEIYENNKNEKELCENILDKINKEIANERFSNVYTS